MPGDAFSALFVKAEKALPHGHSFTANPLACAVALRSLQLFEEESTLERVTRIGERHLALMPKLHALDGVTRPRALGTVLACDLSSNAGDYKSDESLFLRDWYLAHGFNIRPIGSTLYLMPPFCITDEELSRAYDGLIGGIEALNSR